MDGRRNFSSDPDAESRWHPDGRGYDDRGYDDRRDDQGREARDDRGRDERGYGDDRSRDPRGRDDADRGYGEGRGYGDDRGYTPTRYADEREYDDGGYRAPEPRGGGRAYGADSLSYGDSPSGQFTPAAALGRGGGDSGEFSGEFGGRARRSEAIDRSALQRPVSGGGASGGLGGGGGAAGGLAGASIPGLTTSGSPIQGLPTVTPSNTGSLGSMPQGGTVPVSGGPVSGMPGSGAPSGAGFGGPAGGGAGFGGPGMAGAGGTTGSMHGAFAAPTALTAAVPAPQQPFGAGNDPGGAVYRSKRPGLAVALVVVTVLFEVPVLRLFLEAMTAKDVPAGATLAGIFMIPALPMFSLGLYGLIGGAAAAAPGGRAWLRTPLAYLPLALLLFVAAGLAA